MLGIILRILNLSYSMLQQPYGIVCSYHALGRISESVVRQH